MTTPKCAHQGRPPLILSTWSFAPVGADAAFPLLASGGDALDAAIGAVTVIEDDPTIHSVGVGGLPDAEGRVSLDACVMENPDRCGAVCNVQRHANPAAIARRVMDTTIHVTLAGDEADSFATREGFVERTLLTPEAQKEWQTWRHNPANINREKYRGWLPPMNVEEMDNKIGAPGGVFAGDGPDASHDTVGVLTLDMHGKIAGACSTSGMAFKVPGRVGDSPIIGQGLYVDQTAGAACATGTGELITGVCGSFLVVELMRRGATPLDAVRETLQRIIDRFTLLEDHQVAMLALTPSGDWASAAIRPGFHHVVTTVEGSMVEDPHAVLQPA